MNDFDALLASVRANPQDDTARLVLADFLDENCGTVTCDRCNGNGGWTNPLGGYREFSGSYPTWESCFTCSGSGTVPDRRAERAEFIRLGCEVAKNLADHPRQVEWLRQMPVEQWTGGEEEGRLLRQLDAVERRHREIASEYVSDNGPWSNEFVRAVAGPNWLQVSAAWEWFWWSGFIKEVHMPLAHWCGGPCDRCDGTGWERVADSAGDMDDQGCRSCSKSVNAKGSGRTPAFGPLVVRDRNVVLESVVLADREPDHVDRDPGFSSWRWVPMAYNTHRSNAALPQPIYERCSGWFATREDAMAGLSAAALAWALSVEPEEVPACSNS